MSNTICVKINGDYKWLPVLTFLDNKLKVFYKNNWIEVVKIDDKDSSHGKIVFQLSEVKL